MRFELGAPLPQGGLLVLQASAGTGKTHAVATLAARFVAEGRATLPEVMVVTFSGASTRELRTRVRRRLTELLSVIDAALGGAAGPSGDEAWDAVLAGVDDLARARGRVTRALGSFDAATICTTHQFCDRMLAELGVLADHEPGTTLVDDLSELVAQATSDEYLRRYAATGDPGFTLETATAFCRHAVDRPAAPLLPGGEAGEGPWSERVALAESVRAIVGARKRELQWYSFDDMQVRLLAALQDPVTGEAARHRVRRRFPVVLVDEFQDTDPVQWQIIQHTFAHPGTTTILIGDPKQSIYGFRGADVEAYLEAVGRAQVLVLDANRRSTPELVAAVDAVFGGAALGDPQIVVEPVRALGVRRLEVAGPWSRPFRIRHQEQRNPRAFFSAVVADLVDDVVALLGSGAVLTDGPASRPVTATDVAVIVSTNARGRLVQDGLSRAGVPAIFTGSMSVFSSPAAQDWRRVLVAVDRPRQPAVRAAALTDLVGWDLQRLSSAGEDEVAALTSTFRRWGRLYDQVGVAGLLQVLLSEGLAERVLRQPQGERILADLRHVAELLHTEQTRTQATPLALVEWLEEHAADSRTTLQDDRSRRLETDDAVVRILTVHQAKGLEFPVVYLPDLALRSVWDPKEEPVQLHVERDGGTVRALDVGGKLAPGRAQRVRKSQAEDAAESLRTLYVALTRAQTHVTTWWARTDDTITAAFHRVLFRDPASPLVPDVVARGDDDLASIQRIALVDVLLEPMAGAEGPTTVVRARPAAARVAAPAPFTRAIDQEWQRTSYSALTAAAHETVAHDPESGLLSDEPALPEDAFPPVLDPDAYPTTGPRTQLAPGLERRSPMADLPGGVAFGSLVHAVFEYLDPGAAAPEQALREIVAEQAVRLPVPGVTTDELVAAMLPGLDTPLGPLLGERTLRQIPVRDRLAELDFELPLGSGHHGARISTIADLLAEGLPDGHLLADYPRRLREAGLDDRRLRGFLTGSIDATLRADGRFVVADYKTNRLAPPSTELLLAHYTPRAMAEAMMASHYPLQAVLYTVALHRFLRWRLQRYDPQEHLGGVAYLFVRGMAGADTPRVGGTPCGVFTWQPPASTVTALSDLLGGMS